MPGITRQQITARNRCRSAVYNMIVGGLLPGLAHFIDKAAIEQQSAKLTGATSNHLSNFTYISGFHHHQYLPICLLPWLPLAPLSHLNTAAVGE